MDLGTLREVREALDAGGGLHDCCYGTADEFCRWLDESIAALEAGDEPPRVPDRWGD